MEIVVIRHAQTLSNARAIYQGQLDGELSEKGIEQAITLQRELEGQNFDLVVSSDLWRAAHTAQLLFPTRDDIVYDKRLRERHWGDLQGTPIGKEVDYFATSNNAEPIDRIIERVTDFLSELKNRHTGKKIAIISHGITISAIYSICEQRDIRDISVVDNCSVNIIEL